MSGEERLRKNGISRKYQEEVLVPETRRRLNQDVTEVSDLALSMAVYDENQGISQTGGHIIPTLEEMLLNSGAQLRLQTEIMGGLKHQLVRTGEWEWILQSHQIGREVEQSSFQKVIIATPWDATTNENIDTLEEIALASEYRPRHITLFTTTQSLDPEIFGQQESLPDWILPTMIKPLDHLDGIHEIAHVRNLTRTTHHTTVIERLYRILSTHEIGDEWLASLFVHRDIAPTWVHRDKVSRTFFYQSLRFKPDLTDSKRLPASLSSNRVSSYSRSRFFVVHRGHGNIHGVCRYEFVRRRECGCAGDCSDREGEGLKDKKIDQRLFSSIRDK